jgi:hypothetical protein
LKRWPGIDEIGEDLVWHLQAGRPNATAFALRGLVLNTLDNGTLLEVETESGNSYVIEVLDAERGSIRILGGKRFPLHSEVSLRRSLFLNDLRSFDPAIAKDASMVLRSEEQGDVFITSRVVKVGRFGKFSGNE